MSAVGSEELKEVGVGDALNSKNVEEEKIPNSDAKNECEAHNEHDASDTLICAENELINLDNVHLSDDEDTWLYTSPKNLTKEQKGMSPYKWLRKDVEDPSNYQLQIAKSALVSKLDELDILGHSMSRLRTKSLPVECEVTKKKFSLTDIMSDDLSENGMDTVTEEPELGVPKLEEEKSSSCIKESEKPKLKDASDVLARARQQEESLKLSSKFFYESARTFPRVARMGSSQQGSRSSNVSKPVSIETLHAYDGTQSPVSASYANVAQKKLLHSSPAPSPFGSTASLNLPSDLHRSSLPNLSRNYLSLRTKKSKRTSESHIQCPLPAYPRGDREGAIVKSETLPKSTLYSPKASYGESKTLPSSYRSKSKKNLVSSNVEPTFSAIRRESSPSTFCQKINPLISSPRRESTPCVSSQGSPRRITGMYSHHGGSVPALQHSKTVSINQLSPEINESQRSENVTSLHSKRQPLSSVHNRSPKCEDKPVIHDNGELSKLKPPSKIPSPSIRSGIPVPSTQHTGDKSNDANKNWSQDFY